VRRVYLMTDHHSSSLWTDEPVHGMVHPERLGVSDETTKALRAWSVMEERNLDAWFDKSPPPFPRDVYMAEGLRLWRVVREELAGECEVGFAFFDPDPEDEYSSIKRIEWDPDAPGARWPPTS